MGHRIYRVPSVTQNVASPQLQCITPSSRKFYEAYIGKFSDGSYITWVRFGRIGASGQLYEYYRGANIGAAYDAFTSQIESKMYPPRSKDPYRLPVGASIPSYGLVRDMMDTAVDQDASVSTSESPQVIAQKTQSRSVARRLAIQKAPVEEVDTSVSKGSGLDELLEDSGFTL